MIETVLRGRLGMIPGPLMSQLAKLRHEQLLELGSRLLSIHTVEELGLVLEQLRDGRPQ